MFHCAAVIGAEEQGSGRVSRASKGKGKSTSKPGNPRTSKWPSSEAADKRNKLLTRRKGFRLSVEAVLEEPTTLLLLA